MPRLPVTAEPSADQDRVARLREVLQRDLDLMLQWRGPVAEVRGLVEAIDSLAQQAGTAATAAEQSAAA